MTDGKLSANHIKVNGEWIESQNVWLAVLQSEDTSYEMSIVYFTLAYLFVNFASKKIGNWYGYPLSIRPTIIASTGHAAYTAVASCVILFLGPDYYWLWQKIFLPSSIGYFIHDIIIYCIPRKDVLITVHHLVMIFCHFPTGEHVGAYFGGAGNARWTVWLSIVGYTSEFAVPLSNYRWWLSQTMEKHTTSFYILSWLVLASFLIRCVVMGYLLQAWVLPRFEDFMLFQQAVPYFVIVLGHVSIFFLSGYWVHVSIKGGLHQFLHFKKRPKTKGTFDFTNNFSNVTSDNSDTSDASDNDEKKDKKKN